MQHVWSVSIALYTEQQELVCIRIAYCARLARPQKPIGCLSRDIKRAFEKERKKETDQGLQTLRVIRVLFDVKKHLEAQSPKQTFEEEKRQLNDSLE